MPRGVDPEGLDKRRTRVWYSDVLYYSWWIATVVCLLLALLAAYAASWGEAFALVAVALGLSSHARHERMEGHVHRGGVDVP